MQPTIKFRFDSHGLGDCVHAAIAIQLYRRLGYQVHVKVEDNKRWLWEMAGATIDQDSTFPVHGYPYKPSMQAFFDMSIPDCHGNKVVGFFDHPALPSPLTFPVEGTPKIDWQSERDRIWYRLLDVDLSATAAAAIGTTAKAEAAEFLHGLQTPIVALHTKGTNWQLEKSIPDRIAWELLNNLIDYGATVIVMDFDARVPTISGHPRVKNIKPTWGHLSIEQQAALLTQVHLMVGVDSGPFHLASLLRTPALGCFRQIPAHRCCIPSPSSTYLFRAFPGWDKGRDEWSSIVYDEHIDADTIMEAVDFRLDFRAKRSATVQPEPIAGHYVYRRVGYDERTIELLPDGTIGQGRGEAERTWRVANGFESPEITISGDHGDIVTLKKTQEGLFVGFWNKFEQMPIELIKTTEQADTVDVHYGTPAPITYQRQKYDFVSYSRFANDCHDFARKLPRKVKAVAGIPRGGVLAASIIALELNVPLISIESLEAVKQGARLQIPSLRRQPIAPAADDGIILVVDDGYCTGRQMAAWRVRLPDFCEFGAIYSGQKPDIDHGYITEDQTIHRSYEWTLFHDDNTERTICDLDGVLCEDWIGDEVSDRTEYKNFLERAAPLRIPSQPLLGIATRRLERHRDATVAWLKRHGIRYGFLEMAQESSVIARDAAPPDIFKANIYLKHEAARLFVESNERQASGIFRITQRPVLCFPTGELHSL